MSSILLGDGFPPAAVFRGPPLPRRRNLRCEATNDGNLQGRGLPVAGCGVSHAKVVVTFHAVASSDLRPMQWRFREGGNNHHAKEGVGLAQLPQSRCPVCRTCMHVGPACTPLKQYDRDLDLALYTYVWLLTLIRLLFHTLM